MRKKIGLRDLTMDGDTILSFYLIFIVQRKWTNGTTNFGAGNEAHNVSGKFFFI